MKKQVYLMLCVYLTFGFIIGCGKTTSPIQSSENIEEVTELKDTLVVNTEIINTDENVADMETDLTETEEFADETETIVEILEETETIEIEPESDTVDISAYVTGAYDLEKSKQLFEMANQVRIENGVAPLEWDDRLYVTGAIRAEEITREWSHTRPDGSKWSTVSDSSVLNGENLARGYSIENVIGAWMDSQTHKENLLRTEFTRGAIVYYNDNGYEYWVHHFGC